MIAIKNFEKPNECYQCELLDEHGVCSITGNDIFADCPLVEIGNCKDCVKGHKYKNLDECFCDYLQDDVDTDFYCAEFKKRGSEE